MSNKKVRTNTLTLSIVLAVSLSLFNCGSDDKATNQSDGKPPADLIGSWSFRSVTVDGIDANLDSVMEWQSSSTLAQLFIGSNRAYELEELDNNGEQSWLESGFVFVANQNIEFNALQNSDGTANETTSMTFVIDGDLLTLRQNKQGQIIVYSLEM